MHLDADRIVRLLVDTLVRRHGDEVDLVFRYGSLLRGDPHRFSDLDISWVPAHAETWDAITVLVDDVLVDCYAIHWPSLEQMADMRRLTCAILEYGEVVYARDDAVRARFEGLRARLATAQSPAARPSAVAAALDTFREAGYPYLLLTRAARDGHLLAALQQAQAIRDRVLHALVLANQVPADTRKPEQLARLARRPPDLDGLLAALDASPDAPAILNAVDALLDATRAFLLAEQSTLATPTTFADALRAGYPELRGDLQHLLLWTERGTIAPRDLVSIHHETMVHAAKAITGIDYGPFNAIPDYELDLAALGFPDLLGPTVARDLPELARLIDAFDARLRRYLEDGGADLCSYPDLDGLEAALATG
ncbi:MAG TPA: nucleotidyltransferase domain-containing protein [Candidatus Limnocylindrales bacterium]|nr:nucleotidyltransferase domain-containing protein [Candidatus Limnocylindrales bacterium]